MIRKLLKLFFWLSVFAWALGYVSFFFSALNKEPEKTRTRTGAIVVLTGGNNRVQTGLSLFANEMSKELFITGVHASVSKKDIQDMWKGNKRLPSCCITLGQRATTTQENAYETKAWLQRKREIKSIRLVTSAYHIERALLEYKQVIKNVEIIPHPVHEKPDEFDIFAHTRLTFTEYNKILFRKLVIKIEDKG